jgi:K+/H+ antiporter YhaU regulatory subunit KhtT
MRRLQHEITRVRGEHVKELARLKSKFEYEIQQQRTNENAKVESIQQQANQVSFILKKTFIFEYF